MEKQLALLVNIVNSSNAGIITKTLEGVITSWNKGAEKSEEMMLLRLCDYSFQTKKTSCSQSQPKVSVS